MAFETSALNGEDLGIAEQLTVKGFACAFHANAQERSDGTGDEVARESKSQSNMWHGLIAVVERCQGRD